MKRKVWLLTAAALWIISAAALGGCSAYHKIEEETSGPKVEVVESQTEQEEGPTLAPNTGEPETVQNGPGWRTLHRRGSLLSGAVRTDLWV